MNLEIITHSAGSSRYPPVVFVHGGFHAAWCWDEYFLPCFRARGFDVHALSLRGHGRCEGRDELDSWGPDDDCTDIAQQCQDFPEFPVLVGHPIGAAIVQRYAHNVFESGYSIVHRDLQLIPSGVSRRIDGWPILPPFCQWFPPCWLPPWHHGRLHCSAGQFSRFIRQFIRESRYVILDRRIRLSSMTP
jgi:hypothetical protein